MASASVEVWLMLLKVFSSSVLVFSHVVSANQTKRANLPNFVTYAVQTREEESRYKLQGPRGPEGGPGCDYVRSSVMICGLHKLILSDQDEGALQLRSVFLM